MPDYSPVPLTLEGASVLHQFFRFNWKAWRVVPEGDRALIVDEAKAVLGVLEKDADGKVQTALFSELGHKGDLVLVHFRDSLEALNRIELALAQTRLYDFLDLRHSYVSVVELGLYESTRKTQEAAAAKGFVEHSPEWNAEIKASLDRGAAAMDRGCGRLYRRRNICASIPWTASATSTRTGTWCRLPSGRG